MEETFAVSTAGNYQITLTDLGAALTPSAPLSSVKLAVTSGATLVGTPLLAAGSTTISATPGSYVIHVIGSPGSVPGSGPIGIAVSNTASNDVVASFSDTLAPPPQALSNSVAVLDDTFTATGGSYTVSLADLQLPQGQSLTTLTLLLIAQGDTSPLAILPDPTTHALTATVTLSSGVTYSVFAIGQAGANATGGLFSAIVAPAGGGAPVYARTRAIGGTLNVGSPALSAGNYTFNLNDLSSPAALSQVQAMVVLNGVPAATLPGAGTQNFAAVGATYDVFAFATPATATGAGSYALAVLPQPGGAAALDVARAVATPGGALSAYSFDATLSAAGTYTLAVADFANPAALTSLQVLAAQNGALLGAPVVPVSGKGSGSITAASGPITVLGFAQATSAGGLFGADLTASGADSPVYEVTQGVGNLFQARRISITSAGAYAVTATDLGFPANFANYDTIVTQGTSQIGSIFGGGTFNFTATAAGNYFINFIAQPTGPDQAGTYGLSVATAPAAPVVTLSVDHTQVASGSTVDVIWSSQNATTCTASGGWSGSKPVSGTATSAALLQDTTFTLSCTGAGGTQSKSATVTVTAAASGGGGGAVSPAALLLLLAVLSLRLMQPARVQLRRTT
ncbi:MAG TPA: hypothetical protein VKB72_10030 [Steroidobacteraceae bacterium]|nr:hypothetical protein [Steroidobacteraceae bacterium]